jgi:hypothetical protein
VSLETISPKRPGRVYRRAFDHEEAKALRQADPKTWTYAHLAEHFGVSENAVFRVLIPGQQERYARRALEWARAHRRPCKGGCGRLVWAQNKGRSGLCVSCMNRARATSVRPDTLHCGRCREWKPDQDFPLQRSRKTRRGRASLCRPCQTVARREHRQRNHERERQTSHDYRRRRREEKAMSAFIVFQPNGKNFVEHARVEAASAEHAVEKAATEPGEYVAVPVSRFKLMRVAPVKALRVVKDA